MKVKDLKRWLVDGWQWPGGGVHYIRESVTLGKRDQVYEEIPYLQLIAILR